MKRSLPFVHHAPHIRRSRGNTAIEFALLFPLFFMILYGIVTFSMIFVAQQSLTLAAQEGARATLKYQPAKSDAEALTARVNAACPVANGLTNWLADVATCTTTTANCSFDATMTCVTVTLTYDYASNPLVPEVPLLNAMLPTQLTSHAMIQLNPGYLL
jgi:Flp pilus assembly protein TadG